MSAERRQESKTDEERLRLLQQRRINEFERLGIDPEVVSYKESILARNKQGDLVAAGHIVAVRTETKEHCYTMETKCKYVFNLTDGTERKWDAIVYLLPTAFLRDGNKITLPNEVGVLGYQIYLKNYKKTNVPMVRIDAICIPSMLMNGHRAVENDEALGCDCSFQRNKAHGTIYKHGGMTILTPFEGRGNGLDVHTGQLMIQWSALQYREAIPDTYEAVESLKAPKDNRLGFYPMDAMVLRIFGKPEKIKLLSNNPQKAEVLVNLGIQVELTAHHARESVAYYNGKNYQTKVRRGGHMQHVIFSDHT